MWLKIDAGREACWKDRPLPQDLQAGDQHRTSDSIMCLCEVGPYNSHWWTARRESCRGPIGVVRKVDERMERLL